MRPRIKRDVLFVGLKPENYEKTSQRLSLAEFRSDFISTTSGAIELIGLLPYDAIVVAYPPPDLPVERLLDVIRREGSTCRRAAVVMLTDDAHVAEASWFVGRGANRVIDVEAAAGELQETLAALISAAPRIPLRALTRLEVPSDLGPLRVLCQTVNVSLSGMLIRIDERFDLGSTLGFELTVPGEAAPVRGSAEVIRHSMQRREPVQGVGLRFSSFRGDDQGRFVASIARLAS